MTLRMQLIMTDDLDEHENNPPLLTQATRTVTLSIDGIVRELHLTEEHDKELRAAMGRYIDAGHEPGAGPVMEQPPPEPEPRPGQGRRREIPGTREFYRKVRRHAALQGIEVRTSGGLHKTYIYPEEAYTEFVLYLKGLAREGDPQAIADLAMARRLGLPDPPD